MSTQQALIERKLRTSSPRPVAPGRKRLLAMMLDPFMLGPLYFALLILQTVATFPLLTFSLAGVLGFDLNFTDASWPMLAVLWTLRIYFLAVLVKAAVCRSLVIPGFLSAALLYFCYFPFAIGWLGWVALVPLLWLVRSPAPAWRTYLYAWYAGLAFFWPVLEWMRVADFRMYGTWAMLATYCALYFPAALFLIRRLDRSTPLPFYINVAIVWTGLEFLRSFLLTGFAWYYLGHSQQAFLPIIQISDLAGAYAVSFLMAAVNGCLFECLYSKFWFTTAFRFAEEAPATGKPRSPGSQWLAVHGFVAAALVVAALFYGFWRLDQQEFAAGPRIALLQGNLDQRLRNEATGKSNVPARLQISRHYMTLTNMAVNQKPSPELVVWPETSFPAEWYEVSPRLPADKIPATWVEEGRKIQALVRDIARVRNTNLLLGMNSNVLDEDGREVRFNSAILTSPTDWGPRYDKIHRVPFGEYVPQLPFMDQFAPYDFPYSITPGEHFTRFPLGEHHFGVLICFEDTDPYLARQYARKDADGPAVDFLVNTSNDGWFDGSSEHDEHLAICRFRAIECRRAVARAVNMGISAVIDGNGRILPPQSGVPYELANGDVFWNWHIVPPDDKASALPQSQWSEFKKSAGVISTTVPIDRRASLYAILGDWLAWTCWAVVLAGLVWSFARQQIRPGSHGSRLAVSGAPR